MHKRLYENGLVMATHTRIIEKGTGQRTTEQEEVHDEREQHKQPD